MNVLEEWKLGNIYGESCYHRIECLAANFLATFMWRRLLNSAALATTTHKRPKNVSNGISTK